MRIKLFIIIIGVIFLCQCKTQNKKTVELKTVQIYCSEMYCGGAAPPEELIAEMNKPKPFANKNIQIFTEKNAESKPLTYKTDSSGKVLIPSHLGKVIFINLYSPIEKDYADEAEYKCYKSFINASLITIDNFNLQQEIFKVISEIRCNPCIPAAP